MRYAINYAIRDGIILGASIEPYSPYLHIDEVDVTDSITLRTTLTHDTDASPVDVLADWSNATSREYDLAYDQHDIEEYTDRAYTGEFVATYNDMFDYIAMYGIMTQDVSEFLANEGNGIVSYERFILVYEQNKSIVSIDPETLESRLQ